MPGTNVRSLVNRMSDAAGGTPHVLARLAACAIRCKECCDSARYPHMGIICLACAMHVCHSHGDSPGQGTFACLHAAHAGDAHRQVHAAGGTALL